MGLDGVELVMEVEDEFGIRIPDAEAEQIRTVGDLTRTVQRKLGIDPRPAVAGEAQPCLTAAAFYRLRGAWAKHCAPAGIRLRPSTPLASASGGLWGRLERRRLWMLARRARVHLPPLAPVRVAGALLLLMVGFAAFAGLFVALATGYSLLAPMCLALAGVLAAGVQEMGFRLPPGVVTVGDALRACEQPNVCPGGDLSLTELERKVIRMVGEQLGYDPAILTLESRFVEDLDMD